ncbi:MAG: hypothetical protein ABSF50_23415, partial [Burkholderiaceae bacterium]
TSVYFATHSRQRSLPRASTVSQRISALADLIDYLIEPFPILKLSSIDLLACFQHPQHPIALASLITG